MICDELLNGTSLKENDFKSKIFISMLEIYNEKI